MRIVRIVPALDVMRGRAVRGRGGRRSAYRPEPSVLVEGDDPVAHALALAAAVGHATVYVADLDALMGVVPPADGGMSRLWTDGPLPPAAGDWLGALRAAGLAPWLDAGVRTRADLTCLQAAGAARLVVGTETLAEPAALADDPALILSLDMNAGTLLAPPGVWANPLPEAVAAAAVAAGVRTILLLDLADVGAHAGPRTLPLLAPLRARFPNVEWLLGGGVRNADDLRRCRAAGAAGVLVASALHDGRIAPADLAAFRRVP